MIARLLTINLGPGARAVATRMADEGYAVAKSLPGFAGATYMIHDEAAGEYGSLTLWKSEAEATAAADRLGAWMRESYGDKLKAPPQVRVSEVYEPA
jgi:heme-degrading monooxygenase HmoA